MNRSPDWEQIKEDVLWAAVNIFCLWLVFSTITVFSVFAESTPRWMKINGWIALIVWALIVVGFGTAIIVACLLDLYDRWTIHGDAS